MAAPQALERRRRARPGLGHPCSACSSVVGAQHVGARSGEPADCRACNFLVDSQRLGRHRRRPPLVGAPVLPRVADDGVALDDHVLRRGSGPHQGVVPHACHAPRRQRHAAGSAQPPGGLLARALRLALLRQALHTPRARARPGDPGAGAARPLPRQALLVLGPTLVPRHAGPRGRAVGRADRRVPLRRGLPLVLRAAHHLLRELRGARRAGAGRRCALRRDGLGHRPQGQPLDDAPRVGRGVARLPPPLPLGLRRCRAGSLGPVEPDQGLHRHVQRAWHRVWEEALLEVPARSSEKADASEGCRSEDPGHCQGRHMLLRVEGPALLPAQGCRQERSLTKRRRRCCAVLYEAELARPGLHGIASDCVLV
mmetsp:Transcript_92486/g.258531  ORF Transcript_92486/g.258531 Transcript_92486/m.258531 type:complete len:369 (-) Transcript_92486:189-1295(-)